MPQVLEFRLPDLGEGLTEAEIVRWLVEVGDVVAIDQPVVEVETAKAMVEVPCPYGGVVTARFGDEGAELPVGAPLLTVAVGSAVESAGGGAEADSGTEDSGSGNVLVGYGTGAPPGRRRRVRPEGLKAPVAVSVAPVEAPAPAPASVADPAPGPVAVVSPLVRRLARQHDLDLRGLAGSGPDGLILRADVESAIRSAAEAPAPQAAASSAPAGERVALRGVRGAVADKLARSRREIPDATCWVDADATELMAARAAMNGAAGAPKVSVLALLARICTAALARYPELNSTVDQEAREIVRLPQVHLGFAAQTDRGLVVPVVRDAHARTTESIGAEIARLTEAARAGSLTPAELTGGTFTLNNYGVFGVDGSTPIINHPEAAMLGVGRIVPKPWVHEGELAVRQVVQLSLTFDHRVCDGGTAGGFLRYVADCVERPALLLRSV
ncbi:dihydrolipoamide acetyltransferase family protein [Streptomyces sp. SID9727]|uniref:dihydrolipoamide acetyltransferase family protein n=1 Tax=Streptomyces sp. SID9727 TaxID=2706114 RepID=UPI0013C54B26|nr:dihydrolipoamide acetyltransferase family protein [Streptomyces sp. SID9727]NEC63144.1 2-oxo acid dehydrogenase subunit E2 [Streptomyces sp. SID9727]